MPDGWADATRYGTGGAVCTVDHLASSAGVDVLRDGGSAADAAIAANAVLAVTTQHMCGMGGDLVALVAVPGAPVRSLLAVGRAGSGSDADRLRAEGHTRMPFRDDLRTTTVPGCVDGWLALHAAYGRLPLDRRTPPRRRTPSTASPSRRCWPRRSRASPTCAAARTWWVRAPASCVAGRPWPLRCALSGATAEVPGTKETSAAD